MSTNGQLNGSRNGNGARNGNGSLDGNGNYTRPKPRWYHWDITSDSIPPVAWIQMVIICGLLAFFGWSVCHPPPSAPVDPRTQRIEKAIVGLQDAIDVLREELPPEDDGANDYTSPYLQ